MIYIIIKDVLITVAQFATPQATNPGRALYTSPFNNITRQLASLNSIDQ